MLSIATMNFFSSHALYFLLSSLPSPSSWALTATAVSTKLGRIVVFVIRIGNETKYKVLNRITNRTRILSTRSESYRIIIRLIIRPYPNRIELKRIYFGINCFIVNKRINICLHCYCRIITINYLLLNALLCQLYSKYGQLLNDSNQNQLQHQHQLPLLLLLPSHLHPQPSTFEC